MLKNYIIIFITITLLIKFSLSSKILIWCVLPSPSHHILYQPIVRELSLRGHQVTFITTNPINDPTLTNLTEINCSNTKDLWKHVVFAYGFGILQYKLVTVHNPDFAKALDLELSNEIVRKVLFDEHFDLFIGETNYVPALALLKQHLKCPIINLASMNPSRIGYQLIGEVVNPSYESHFMIYFDKPINFWQRLLSTYYFIWDYYMWTYKFVPRQIEVIKKYFGDKIENYDEELKVDLILANTHPIFNGVRSNFPTVVEIGGINKPKFKGLPNDLKTFLDSSKEGVIYLSFGSNINSHTLPNEKKQIFINTFKKLPAKILWKYEDSLHNKPDNVFIYKWLPQMDVLSTYKNDHPNVKLFITQGGIQSLEETITARVPIIGIPFIADQFSNIDRFSNSLGVGEYLDFSTITEEKLYNAIMKIWKNESYNKKINFISQLFQDAPVSPIEKAIYWIEYVMRHKNTKILQSPKLNMTNFEYFLLDVILFSLFIVFLFLFICYLIFKKLFDCIFLIKKIKTN